MLDQIIQDAFNDELTKIAKGKPEIVRLLIASVKGAAPAAGHAVYGSGMGIASKALTSAIRKKPFLPVSKSLVPTGYVQKAIKAGVRKEKLRSFGTEYGTPALIGAILKGAPKAVKGARAGYIAEKELIKNEKLLRKMIPALAGGAGLAALGGATLT